MDKNPGLTFSGGLVVKNSPTNAGEEVRSLGWEDPLEKEMANHSRTLAWKTPWTEEPGGLQSMRSQSRTRLRDSTSLSVSGCLGCFQVLAVTDKATAKI